MLTVFYTYLSVYTYINVDFIHYLSMYVYMELAFSREVQPSSGCRVCYSL